MSPWTKFATSFYRQQKKINKNYKFSQALKAAAEVYKKGGNDVKMDGGNGDDGKENKNPVDVALDTGANPDVSGANPDVSGANPGVSGTNPDEPGTNPDVPGQGGKKVKKSAKKAKKSAKKGKKSAKKGGKKARKSAKKRKC